MIARGRAAHVVNTASMAGLIASQGLGCTTPRKYAVVGLSETLAKDLRPHGIGVTVVCPMGVATRIRQAGRNRPAALRNAPRGSERGEMTLIGRTLDADDVACADARSRPGRRALRDHARRGARAAAPPLPTPGGRGSAASTSLTPARATAILCHRV